MDLDQEDIQGNILRGFRYPHARHFALAVGDAAGGRALIGELLPEAGAPHVSSADEWDDKPVHSMNLGITAAGLTALGVPDPTLATFPSAFQQGPAARAQTVDSDFPNSVGLGDRDDSAPANWVVGGPGTAPVHMLLSLFTKSRDELDDASAWLRGAFARNRVSEVSHHDASRLPDGRVHFGYADGIAQPRIRGGLGRQLADKQPEAETGDFLLGKDYLNAYGGNYLGDVPGPLGDNATYGVFRILRQDVAGFEALLARWSKDTGIDPELLAAKLMGRWRNGVPLTLSPETDQPEPPISPQRINDFDFAPALDHTTYYDDVDGVRCPVGSHIRRLNPRGSMVMGKPYTRRILRRGMPYGPPFEPGQADDGTERGLMGYFICGDIEMQYEFIQRAWVNQDFSTHGLRGTREPIIGLQPAGSGKFTVRTRDARDPLVLGGLPNLVDARGGLYCLLPGIGGLRHIASPPGTAAPA